VYLLFLEVFGRGVEGDDFLIFFVIVEGSFSYEMGDGPRYLIIFQTVQPLPDILNLELARVSILPDVKNLTLRVVH
jgi:hypothetical protein